MNNLSTLARNLVIAIEKDNPPLGYEAREALDEIRSVLFPLVVEPLEFAPHRPPMRADQVLEVPRTHRASWCRGE